MNPDRAQIDSLNDGRPVRFSPVNEHDAAASLRYLDEVAAETDYLSFGPGEFTATIEQQAAYFRSLEDGEPGLMIKAEVKGQIVGMASIRRTPRPRIRHVGELGVSVLARFWGTGLGKSLLRYTLSQAPTIGVYKIELRVRQDNVRAIRLYESIGFQIEGSPRAAFLANGTYYDEHFMGIVLPHGV